MGIWWAAGFSTAAIRIIDDDARGRLHRAVGSTHQRKTVADFHCRVSHLPMFLMTDQVCPWMVEMCKSTSSFASSDQKGGDFLLVTRRSSCHTPGNWMKLELPAPDSFVLLLVLHCQVARWTGFGTHTQLYWALYQAPSRLGSQLVLV